MWYLYIYLTLYIFFAIPACLHSQPNWIETNGPNGGLIEKIIIDSSGNYFCGTDQNGIYQSTNQGIQWKECNTGLDKYTVLEMFCTTDSQIYISMQGGTLDKRENYKLEPTHSSWKILDSSFLPFTFQSGFQSMRGTLLFGGQGVRRTDSGNMNFTYKSDSGIFEDNVIKITGTNNGIIYLASKMANGNLGSSIYKSTDDGLSWGRILEIKSGGIIHSLHVSNTFRKNENWIFVGITYVSGFGGLLSTHDEGKTWDTLFSVSSVNDVITKDSLLFLSRPYAGVEVSSDAGKTWQYINQGLAYYPGVWSFALSKQRTLLAGTYRGGVYELSLEDNLWHPLTNGLPRTTVNCMVTVGSDTIIAGTEYTGINISTDQGNSWKQSNNGLTETRVRYLILTNKRLLYAGAGTHLFMSTNL